MKLFALAAAGLVAITGLAPTALVGEASAQRTVVHKKTVVYHGRPAYNHHRTYTRRVCNNVWRHGHRQRVCRTVRYRR